MVNNSAIPRSWPRSLPPLKGRHDTDKGGALPARVFQSLPLGVMIAEGVLGHILETLVSLCCWLNVGFSVLTLNSLKLWEWVQLKFCKILCRWSHCRELLMEINSGYVYLGGSWEWSCSCFFSSRQVSESLLICLYRTRFFFFFFFKVTSGWRFPWICSLNCRGSCGLTF